MVRVTWGWKIQLAAPGIQPVCYVTPCDTFSYKCCVDSRILTPGLSTLCSFFLG